MPRTTGSGSPTASGSELSVRIRCASALWIGLAAWLVACGEGDRSPQPRIGTVQFRYAPPDATAYVETAFTRVRVRSASRLRGWHETEEKVGVEVARSESGFRQTSKGIARRTWLNGIAYNDPRNASFAGRELTYHIDPAGRLTAVGGVRELVDRLHGAAKEPASRKSQTERAMLDRLQDQWNRAIGDLAGKSFAIGETVEATFPFRLPGGGVIAMTEKILALRFVACPAGRCVLVLQDYQSDDGSLAAYVRESLKGDPIVAAQGARAAPTGTRVASSTSRVIDPETMRIYQDDGSESAIFTLDVPGLGPVRFERVDEGRRRFDYR